jgi:hypothetical protein
MSETYGTYWASDEPTVAINSLMSKTTDWSDLYNNAFQAAWVRNFLAYYSPAIVQQSWDTSLVFQGEQGELVRMHTPKARVAINRLKALISQQRLSYQCMAEVMGTDVSDEIKIGNGLTDQIIQNERLDLKGPECLEGAFVCGKWFMKAIWSSERGDAVGYRDYDGKLLRTGGPEVTTHSPFDVFYDVDYNSTQERPWMMVRLKRSRWDLVAEHPDMADSIRALPSAQTTLGASYWFNSSFVNYDTVVVYEFYHKPCPAIPQGRIIIFSDMNTVYYDDINRYGIIPIEEMTPETVLTTGLGYPKLTDLLGSQEMYDNTISAVVTNSSQFAVQNVLVSRNANINLEEINGMRFVSYTPENVPGGGKPEALNLSQTAPETFKLIELLSGNLDSLSLMNGALQGQPPPGVTSGTAIATLAASGIQSLTPYSLCYNYCLEKVMWHCLNAYQKFGDAFQTLKMSGKNSQITGKLFNKDSIKNLSGVKIITTNPLMQTIAGRLEIGEKILSMPRDLWADYSAILNGEDPKNLTRGVVTQSQLMEQENEQMASGQQVPVLATDNHPQHMKCHNDMLSDPNVRLNGAVNKIFLDHIMEHYQLSKQTAPDLMYMVQTGQMPATPPPPPSGPAQNGGIPPLEATQGAPQVAGDIAQPSQDLLGR